jgi:hypothetical protein
MMWYRGSDDAVIQSSVMQRFDGAEHYVDGALRLLQYVEARRPTGRRFGADADARWSSFRGDLETVDRIELMIRDADAEWPDGFGARAVFAMQGVAEDEPFGSQWEGRSSSFVVVSVDDDGGSGVGSDWVRLW